MSKEGENRYEQNEETEEESLKGGGPPRKNKGSSAGSEYSEDDDVGGSEEGGMDGNLEGEDDDDNDYDDDDDGLDEAEEDGINERINERINGRNLESEKVEEDIFNENNLLHAIKTREVLEQEILVLFSNMLKKEVVLNKDIKSTSREEVSAYKGDHVDDDDDEQTLDKNEKGGANRKKETEKKTNFKIKNKELYNYIYSKMNLSATEGTEKKREDKGAEGKVIESSLSRKEGHGSSSSRSSSSGSSRRSGKDNHSHSHSHSHSHTHSHSRKELEKSNRFRKISNIEQVEKEHYILDNNVVNILNDINTYLRREREYLNRKFGNHVDSTFKNPMYVTLYIYNNQILKDIILQMINIVKNEFDSSIYRDIDETMLARNIFILINHLTSRPSKEWFDYWNKHMPTFNNKRNEFNVYNYLQIEKNEKKIFSGVLKNDIYFKELQKRSNIIEQYQNGLQSLKCLLSSRNFLILLNEFRYNCQLFIDADYRGIEENEKVLEMQRRDAQLIEEKSRLKEELQFCRERLKGAASDEQEGEGGDDSAEGRGDDGGGGDGNLVDGVSGGDKQNSDDGSGEEANHEEDATIPKKTNKLLRNKMNNLKKRIDEINEELLEVADFFLEDKKKREKLVQEYKENVYLVRNILTQVLGIRNPRRSNAINSNNVHYVILQNVLDSHSALTLIIEEMRHLFDRELKKYDSEKNIHIPYLRQNTMKEIWDYVRLFYNVVCYIDPIDLVRSLTHQAPAGRGSTDKIGADRRGDKSDGRIGGRNSAKSGTARSRLSSKNAPAPIATKRASLLNPRKNNQMIMHLSRINPLLAKSKVRKPNEEKHMKKKKKKFIERKNLIDHYENFSFEDLSFDIFEEKKEGGSFLKGNILDTFDHSNLYRVQEFLNNIIGINEEFENVYEGSSHDGRVHGDDDGFHYSLKVFLNICIKDLRRCIVEYYNHQWDIKIILNIHAWIVTYYTNFYLYENRKRLNNCRMGKGASARYSSSSHFYGGDEEPMKEGKDKEDENSLFISRIQMVLGMQAYIGDNSIHSEFLCDTFQRLIREEKMKKNSSKIILCCLRCLHADLSLVDLHALSTDDNVKSICKSSLDNFLRRNILNSLSWILKNFKLISHDRSIFTYALKCALMIIELLEKLGGSTYILKGEKKIYDEDEEDDEFYNTDGSDNHYGDSMKHGRNVNRDYDAEAIQRVSVMDLIEEIYSGKIVNTCMHIIEDYKRNSIQINHLIITYFEFLLKFKNNEYNFLLFFDMKYFIIFMDVINDQESYTNPRYHWIACFFENIVACFFKLWSTNYFLPLELFFSKAINRSLFSLLSEKYMLSIFSNYSEGNDHFVFEELNKGNHINDIFMEMNSRKRLEALEWSSEDVESLKVYFKQFKHMHNFLPFISEMLNKSPNSVKNQLIFLNYMDRRGNVIEDDVEYDISDSSDSCGAATDDGTDGETGDRMRGGTQVDTETGKGVDTEADTEAESTTPRSACRAATHEQRKVKQPLLYTVYKLKKLNQMQEKETNLTYSGINCNVDTVLEEVISNLKSLYELKKLSKNKIFTYRALLFDIPLSISSELLEHNSFKKLLTLIGFVYKENSDEWVLNEHLDVDIFRSIVEKCEELFPLPWEELRDRLHAPQRDKVFHGGDLSHDDQGSDNDDSGKKHKEKGGTVHMTSDRVPDMTADHSDEQLHLLEPPKLKGTFVLLKLMYDLFISNEDDFRIFFNDLVNMIRDKTSSIFYSRNTEEDIKERKNLYTENDTSAASTASQKKDPNLENYTIFLEPKDRQILKSCQEKKVLSELLQYLWVYISKSEQLIISKHIKENKFCERFRVVNNYKTLGVQEIENIIHQKQTEIDEKKKQKKETKPTSQQKFFFIKCVCEYLHRVYVPPNTGPISTGRNCPLNETYFGGDKLLTCIYEKLNSWNAKRSKKNDETQCFTLAAMDLLSYIEKPSEVNPGVTITTGTTVTPPPQSADPNSFLPLVQNICSSLKASKEEDKMLKWHPQQVQRKWLKIMLKLFYNVLYDSEYNTVGKLFLEYKNIKDILKDKSLDFLSPQGGEAEVVVGVQINTVTNAHGLYSGIEELQKEDPSQPFTEEMYLERTQYEVHTEEAPSKRTSRPKGATTDQNKTDAAQSKLPTDPKKTDAIVSESHVRENPLKPIAPHKRKLGDIYAQDYSEFFKKRKLQNAYINMYRKNRKSIIDSLLKNNNIAQYNESDIINRVKQVFIKARQMASTGDLRNRWKSREDVKRILLL
ncbi:conserved Plasmodium protein, unknown function [Plasmodium knowlesi strain H]|uniref:Uncharacterized protein n=3 Tax=Plasmodium knowlesi TaxID=5850 RepID=A0A5E7WV90_PLAKH|nr:conserved Plasmodium protein, unknown function [Plasmodium knowlesi strain H]OTN66747.1 Uncharacterized protein PKNOH_S08498100 [Plasmodium knowlesi]CAA9986750.1 conserved Plasmodium protein, unknown function [Plasmodium knowlesi strain H]SBO23575.1 conserved Plasmodium protein, unknown function [Plasmodium knowlesi strain H]SBO25117.1 conserved Plasmodium protein, unknown function [Plasmodium knowlesi strain H]VVS76224.1 conserved Plasmodium protein, unknown function [Plasmodium knowlesi s